MLGGNLKEFQLFSCLIDLHTLYFYDIMTSVCNDSLNQNYIPKGKAYHCNHSFKLLYCSQLTMDSDSDYDDVGADDRNVINVNDNNVRKPPKKNAADKTTRGGDRVWSELKKFDTAENFLESDLKVKIKAEFVKMRSRQFAYALVEEYLCKYGKKSGYLPCSFALKVIFASTEQTVTVETDCNAEHVHEPDPLYGQALGEKHTYRWTAKMNEIIMQTISTRKPQVALQNMKAKGCFDHLHPEPSMEQLYNKVAGMKKTLNPHPKVNTTHDMRQFIEKHLVQPEDENDAFIPYYDIKDEDPNNLRFTIIFASSKSIDRLKTDNLLSIDATYRLNWMGYPVFVAGMYL